MDVRPSPQQTSGRRFPASLALSAALAVAVFGPGLIGCGQTLEKCPPGNVDADCRAPGGDSSLRPELDPERNLDPATADPEVAEELKLVRLGLASSALTGTVGVGDRGQLATMATGHSASSSLVWVLPDEDLAVQLVEDGGAMSHPLGPVPKRGLGESLVDATVLVSGTPDAPMVELRDGPVGR